MNNKNSNSNSKKNRKKVVKQSNASNVVKINEDLNVHNLIHVKKLKTTFIIVVILIVVLIIRIGFIQFAEGESLKESAYKQQTINQIISPKRGNIYDSTGNALAISASVDTITINPTKIKVSDKDEEANKVYKEKVAKCFSEIFELDYDTVLKKVNSDSQFETIIKKVEQEKVDKLKTWMKENDAYAGINIDEDSKRYYPCGNVASNVIGFCGTDNQGITGIESKWDSVLTGTPGKIVSSKGGNKQEIPDSEETYIAAENGSDINLTIDLKIQTIVEKYLKQAVEENNCENGGNVIVMDPKTGDILAMASYPDYDLNSPFTPNEWLSKTYSSLSDEEKNLSIQTMWKNKSVSDLYEPGSVFKVITSSIALEEHITTPDVEGEFYCSGYEKVQTENIACWKYYDPHRYQSLKKALGNSCNPAFIQLSRKIGIPTTYKYYRAFGLLEKTGVALAGEEKSLVRSEEEVTALDLATMSFGQRLSITPLQMITAVCAVANDGYLMQPRIVKSITNTDTGAITQIEPVTVRQVISKETSEQVKYMMQHVAEHGTGQHGAVTGYTIGGKTGTSEPPENKPELGYVASYVAISPIEDTKVAILLTLYKPPKGNHNGGTLAGPVVSQMLSEILPSLNVPSKENSNTSNNENLITVPEIRNKTITEANKILKDAGFKTKIVTSGDQNTELVSDQMPKPGISLQKNSIVVLYSKEAVATSATVPDLKGMSLYQATNSLKERNLNISYEGSGTVITQEYIKDTQVPEGTVVSVTLKKTLTDTH